MKFETQVFHADFNDDPATNAVAVPSYQTTSYSFPIASIAQIYLILQKLEIFILE